jgi:hypothetical protein
VTQSHSALRQPLSLGMGAVALALLLSCSPPYFVWIAPGSTASHLVFVHANDKDGTRSSPYGALTVATCERIGPDLTRVRERPLWTGEWRLASPAPINGPSRVTYGVQPEGSTRTGAAPPLGPGCYTARAHAGGSGSVTFWVREDRSVASFTDAEHDSVLAVVRRHKAAEQLADQEAHVACLGRYQAAAGDTTALRRADRTLAYDTTRFGDLRCEDLARFDSTLIGAGATPLAWGDDAPESMLGDFEDDYRNRFVITRGSWTQMPHGKLRVVKWVPSHSYLIAQNDSGNPHAPGLWTRIDWVTLDSMAPWSWAFCLSAYEAPTADSAEATRVARPGTPRTGCNGYPYSRMQRVVRSGQAAADSVAKQKCREAYAAVGADGAGLQSVDDMVLYDTTKAIGRSCGWLRRQDPRLRGAE